MKKTIKLATTLLAATMLLSACSGGTSTQTSPSPSLSPENTSSPEAAVVDGTNDSASDPSEDNRPEDTGIQKVGPVTTEYTTAFSLEYITEEILLVTDAENQKLLLVPRGIEAPEGYDDSVVIYTPVQRALFSSSTQYGMLAPFDVWENMGGILAAGRSDYPFDELNARLIDGRIVDVGGSSSTDYELVQLLNPDITFVYTGTSSANVELIAKLDELGLPYAVDNEYMEERHRGRMEWIKFLAPFFGIEDVVAEQFDAMIARLEEMEEKVAQVERPKIVWGRIVNGAATVAGADSYVAAMIESVGGDYIFSYIEGTSSYTINLEEFYTAALEADIWMYTSNLNIMPNLEALIESAPVLADLPCIVNSNVWQQGLNYFSLTGEIDMQAIELAAIIHPDLFQDYGENYRHFNKLAE